MFLRANGAVKINLFVSSSHRAVFLCLGAVTVTFVSYFGPMKTSSKAKDAKFPPVRLSETGKETLAFPAKNHNQTVIFQQGDPMSNRTHWRLSKPRKSKSNAFVNTFLNFFRLFFRNWGKILLFGPFLGIFWRAKRLVGGFKNPSASLRRMD